MEVATATRVPAGAALSVDRIKFAELITERIEAHPNIEIVREEFISISDLGSGISDSRGRSAAFVDTNVDNSKSEIPNPNSQITLLQPVP
jgi:hypothetical protein